MAFIVSSISVYVVYFVPAFLDRLLSLVFSVIASLIPGYHSEIVLVVIVYHRSFVSSTCDQRLYINKSLVHYALCLTVFDVTMLQRG